MFGEHFWLTPDERDEAIEAMLRFGLIKIDPRRQLPLKSGGKTDIYINMRDARSNPKAIQFLSDLYANPLRRSHADRFIEVPEAVSCLAGPLAIETDLPYITIRETEKSGRVTKGRMVGDYHHGESVPIIDDVITDGASKLVPWREATRAGLVVPSLIVLVDRQQGWERTWEREGVMLPVWAGMTLHDMRKYLIEADLLDRCPAEREDQNRVIVALDGKEWREILPLIDELRPTGTILKVNDLFVEHGADIIDELSVYGRVMLDGKFHDIPNTVANICKRLGKRAPWAITTHASGGTDMVRAAVQALHGTPTKVLAVTVLTSFNKETCEEVYHRLPFDQVKSLANIAHEGGAHGFVCSADEVSYLRATYSDKTLVVPGVRSPGASKGDQERVATPREAIDRGATHLVMGRQILGATDPVAEVKRVVTEELEQAW